MRIKAFAKGPAACVNVCGQNGAERSQFLRMICRRMNFSDAWRCGGAARLTLQCFNRVTAEFSAKTAESSATTAEQSRDGCGKIIDPTTLISRTLTRNHHA